MNSAHGYRERYRYDKELGRLAAREEHGAEQDAEVPAGEPPKDETGDQTGGEQPQ